MKSAKRVLLGMSGGTDSSVAAMLLQEAGYEVTGVTFRFYDSEGFEESLDDARNLASRLNIPHIIYDARELFRERIIRYFVDEYLSAHTPVPCTLCNNELKWPLLAKIADEMGIYWISTGHYIRKVFRDGYYFIAPAADRDKDQTFFLWGLQQNILERMLLPMGDWTKMKCVPMLLSGALNGQQPKRIVLVYASARWITALSCSVKFRRMLCREKDNFSMKAGLF